MTDTERDRQTDRQTGGLSDRQTDRLTHRWACQTDRKTGGLSDRQTETQPDRGRDRQTDRQTDILYRENVCILEAKKQPGFELFGRITIGRYALYPQGK